MTEQAIKARPTLYRGIQMRSRLEADYAAYLDATEVNWEYEPVAFGGPDSQWRPDFRVKWTDDAQRAKQRTEYVEVKPVPLLEDVEAINKLLRRMRSAWLSEPDARLVVAFWTYGAEYPDAEIWASPKGDDDDPEWEFTALWPLARTVAASLACSQASSKPNDYWRQTLTQLWDEVAGKAAAHSWPAGFADGELYVETDSTAWATQVQLLAPSLIKGLNEQLGDGTIRRMRIRNSRSRSEKPSYAWPSR